MSDPASYAHIFLADGTSIGPMTIPDRKRTALVRYDEQKRTVVVLGWFNDGGQETWDALLQKVGVGFLDPGASS